MVIIKSIQSILDILNVPVGSTVSTTELNDALGFDLDDDITQLLTHVGHVKLPNRRFIYGVNTTSSRHDIYHRYIEYTDQLRFFPSNSLPVMYLDSYNILVYDCVQRKVMIVGTSEEGVIKYTFDGGLLEVIRGYLE